MGVSAEILMNCLHCEEEIEPGADVVPVNSGADVMHRECMVRAVAGSADHLRRGPHPVGSCLDDDPNLTKREAAIAAYRAFMECGQKLGGHVDDPARSVARRFPAAGHCTLAVVPLPLLRELLGQYTHVAAATLEFQPPEITHFFFFLKFIALRMRFSSN
jgi:hypothetical protein